MWFNQYTINNGPATMDAMTGILGVMTWIQWVWSHSMVWYQKEWMRCHMWFIWCHTYCGWVIIHTIGVLWSTIWVWRQRYSGCAIRYNRCEVRYNNFDVMSRVLLCHKWRGRCYIQCILLHIYSRCDVINRVFVISSIQGVWSHRHRHEECDVIYSGCIVLTQCISCQI